jgi:hypothetical protein
MRWIYFALGILLLGVGLYAAPVTLAVASGEKAQATFVVQ